MKECIKLRELIEQNGFTIDEYNATVDMLCSKGIGGGCFQNTQCLVFVMKWLTSLDCEVFVEKEGIRI